MSTAGGEESLAAERTSLAWGRTSLSLLVCGAAVVRGVPTELGPEGRPGIGAGIIVLAAATWIHGAWAERRRRAAIAGGGPTAASPVLRAMSASTVAVAVMAFVLAALP